MLIEYLLCAQGHATQVRYRDEKAAPAFEEYSLDRKTSTYTYKLGQNLVMAP